MPFISDLAAIPNVADFGIKFQEGGGNVSESHWLNAHGVDILPYIEPGLISHGRRCHSDVPYYNDVIGDYPYTI
jgi:hypothetical protein